MPTVAENNKRIAKNTIFLYIRLLFNVAVTLYTSRVVLATLGVDDFGLNAVVTSVITIFSFINGSMSSATSRFLTFELGREDFERLRKTFSCALTVHVLIALLIFLLGETVGLWYLENKMVIQEDRITAARWVYQLAIASSMLTITQVPYNAAIMAHEKINVYAYIEILNTCLKLGIVYLLIIGNFDKLILYAILTLCVSVTITFVYRIYCIRHFAECRYKFVWDKSILRPMLSFSGLDLFGNLSLTFKSQGIVLVINMFFASVVNAAFALAHKVNSELSKLTQSIIIASMPQITKYYAQKEYNSMIRLSINVALFSTLLLYSFCLPVILETSYILHTWLKKVPEYTVAFTRLFIIAAIIYTLTDSLNKATNSTGVIRTKTMKISIIYLFVPLISFVLFKMGYRWTYIPLLLLICANLSKCVVLLFESRRRIPDFSIKVFCKRVIWMFIIVITPSSVLPVSLFLFMDAGFFRLLLVAFSSVLSVSMFTYLVAFDRQKKKDIQTRVLRLFTKK